MRAAQGLFNKVKNLPTRRRFVISTIKKGEGHFETVVFEASFFYTPRHLSRPDLTWRTTPQTRPGSCTTA